MNIIDTSANAKVTSSYGRFIPRAWACVSKENQKNLKNIPLFDLNPIEYSLSSPNLKDYTDIIFQSIPSVHYFREYDWLHNKNIYTMGQGTKKFLKQVGVFNARCADIPGSKELIKILPKTDNNKFLIVKGKGGLSYLFDHLNKNKISVEEIINYERIKYESYNDIKEPFLKSDAIIFSSTFSAQIFFEEIYSSDVKAKFFGISDRIKNYVCDLGYKCKFVEAFDQDVVISIKNSI